LGIFAEWRSVGRRFETVRSYVPHRANVDPALAMANPPRPVELEDSPMEDSAVTGGFPMTSAKGSQTSEHTQTR
jgi:hypothetical protein